MEWNNHGIMSWEWLGFGGVDMENYEQGVVCVFGQLHFVL